MIELAESIQHLESSSLAEEGLSPQRSAISSTLDLSFIQEAVDELLRCRRVLKATYAYGYYLTGIVSKKQFEHMQVCTVVILVTIKHCYWYCRVP